MSLKRQITSWAPRAVVQLWRASRAARMDAQFAELAPAMAFGDVYRRGLWSSEGCASEDFCSGSGSHDPHIVAPYLSAVRTFLGTLPRVPNVVDLGCGDFAVGAQLRNACARYVACDVVPALIERNRQRFRDQNVEFQCLDIIAQPLPAGDVVFLRQVLQHLDNRQVGTVLGKLSRYVWAIITEHLPADDSFPPNLDKPMGPGIRLRLGSGVVVARPPFNMRAFEERILCTIRFSSAVIRTTAYRISNPTPSCAA